MFLTVSSKFLYFIILNVHKVCMKKQPSQVRKILDNLFHLSKNDKITSLEVHTTMLPLLKSNPILVDCFFQLIPTERPPERYIVTY